MRSTNARSAVIAAIHLARQYLAMQDCAYRDMLERVSAQYGKAARSAADLTEIQRQAVLEELRRLGAPRTSRQHPGKPHNFDSQSMPELMKKVEALLADMKLPWAYADSIAKQQTGIAKVAWVRDAEPLRGIVAALAVEQEKRQMNAQVDGLLTSLGWAPERVVELLKPLRPHWRRHRPSLKLVIEFLNDGSRHPAAATGTR